MTCSGSYSKVDYWYDVADRAPCPVCGQLVLTDWSGTDAETTMVILLGHEPLPAEEEDRRVDAARDDELDAEELHPGSPWNIAGVDRG